MTNQVKDQAKHSGALAVLVSGGVESAALLTEALQRYERVYPLYVRKGLAWETTELKYLRALLSSLQNDGLAQLTLLDIPVKEIYGHHWSVSAMGTPGSKAPDTAVYLPGRNLLLLSVGGLFCALRKIPTIWIGILKGNPFHDARASFLHQVESLLQETLSSSLRVAAPFREFTKAEVIRRWFSVPWEKTFSCLKPVRGKHCGACQKCAERKKGFKLANVSDPTRYA